MSSHLCVNSILNSYDKKRAVTSSIRSKYLKSLKYTKTLFRSLIICDIVNVFFNIESIGTIRKIILYPLICCQSLFVISLKLIEQAQFFQIIGCQKIVPVAIYRFFVGRECFIILLHFGISITQSTIFSDGSDFSFCFEVFQIGSSGLISA